MGCVLMQFTIETRAEGGMQAEGAVGESDAFSICASYARRERMTDFIRYEVEEGDIASFRKTLSCSCPRN